METVTISKAVADNIAASLTNIGQALNGVTLLLEEISNSTQDKAHEISWTRSIVVMITNQAEQTEDIFRVANGFTDQRRTK